jgi:hypothetical protein
MSKNLVETRGATNDVKIWRIRVACWISKAICTYAHAHAHAPGHALTHTHTQICSTYCVSTATLVSGTRISVTVYVHCVSCSYPISCRTFPRKPGLTLPEEKLINSKRCKWPRGLRRWSAAVRFLGLRVRISLRVYMFMCFVCYVCVGSGH